VEDVSTKTKATRNRGKLQGSNKNISIFKLPQQRIKTLKTTANSGLTDTNFNVRRQFTEHYLLVLYNYSRHKRNIC
jgi:hypothetical protein